MADLLGSILNSMDKPPKVDEKQKQLIKKQREEIAKHEAEMKKRLSRYRQQVESVVEQFIKDEKNGRYSFQPAPKVYRAVMYLSPKSWWIEDQLEGEKKDTPCEKLLLLRVLFLLSFLVQYQLAWLLDLDTQSVEKLLKHEVAEIAGLTAHSFGEEDVDRHVIIFKKEHVPCEEELLCMRRGEDWDPLVHLERKKALEERERLLSEAVVNQKKASHMPEKFREKYEKFLGREAGIEAAIVATPNKQFGNVPSENKKDARTIEQVLADNKARKRQKLDPSASSSSS